MRYLEALVARRQATRWEYRTLRHLQRRVARAQTLSSPVLRVAAVMDVAYAAQSAAAAAALSRLLSARR